MKAVVMTLRLQNLVVQGKYVPVSVTVIFFFFLLFDFSFSFHFSRVFDSEYSSRYTQPTKFKYVDGLWIETPVNTGATYNVKVSMEEMTKY